MPNVHKNQSPTRVLEFLPPIPPKPRTNCAPSCDLSVIISRVAPVMGTQNTNFIHQKYIPADSISDLRDLLLLQMQSACNSTSVSFLTTGCFQELDAKSTSPQGIMPLDCNIFFKHKNSPKFL